MKPFVKITGIAVSIPEINIDTDTIIPKQFLKTIGRAGLGKYLFFDKRFDEDGKLNNIFVLNKKPWNRSNIIIAGDNFGCGSSREHAAWAILDFGISCVISTSFADIFYNNSFKNGLLPIIVDKNCLSDLDKVARSGECVSIDLEKQTIVAQKLIFNFEIDEHRKHCLLNGLDDIGLTLEKSSFIDSYEKKIKNNSWYIPDIQNIKF